MAALPVGWTAHDSDGNTFYFNEGTGETSWEVPAGAPAYTAGDTGAAPPFPDALPAGWAEHQDPGSGKTFYYNATTNETSWEKPAAPAAAAAAPAPADVTWTVKNSYTVGTEDEMNAADLLGGGRLRQACLDRTYYNSVLSTIEQLSASQVAGQERGYVIIWSNSKQKYFLLWRTDMEYEAYTQLNIAPSSDWWSVSQSKELGPPGCEHIFSGLAHCLDTSTYANLADTVGTLNVSQVPGAFEMGFCVMFNQAQQQYTLLWADGKQVAAFTTLNLPAEYSNAAG